MSRLWAPLVIAAVMWATALGCAAEAQTKLRLSTQVSLKSLLGQSLVQFKEEVEKAAQGDLVIELFDSGQLFEDRDLPRAVAAGEIEMGMTALSRYSAAVPAVDVLSVPFLFESDAALNAAVAPDSPARQALDAEILAQTGTRVLWWQGFGGTLMLGKGNVIRSPADLKGRKVRVFGRLLSSWVSGLGGLPVQVASGAQYVAYQRGTVDVGLSAPDTIRSRKIWEVMDTVTLLNTAVLEFVVIVNDKVWQGLSPEQRALLTEKGRLVEAALRTQLRKVMKETISACKQNNMTVYAPTPVEVAMWRGSASAAHEEFLRSSGSLGRTVYQAVMGLR